MTDLQTVRAEVPRDRYGRPLVIPPGGGKPVPYTRCTTFIDCLGDRFRLERWKMRMTALGLYLRPDLMLQVAAQRDNKTELDKITDQAMEAAKASAAANVGTALHALTERVDTGQEIGVIPDQYLADLKAYEEKTRNLQVLGIELFTVNDDLQVGGTLDRLVRYHGETYIGDLKTGNIEWSAGEIAMQLAIYSRSKIYDPKTGQRTPLPDVNQQRAIVVHLPAGEGRCEMHWVDIAAGWEAVQLAAQVRQWRKRKNLMAPFEDLGDDPTLPPPFDLANAIATAGSVEALNALWAEHYHHWTPTHTELAAARKALLLNGKVGGSPVANETEKEKGR